MRNFGSGLTYTINDSTPIIYGNACRPSDFINHMNAQGFAVGVPAGTVGAIQGGITGGPAGALTGGVGGLVLGFAGGAMWGFIEKAHECWF
ncbi:hypothetical protein [Bartonella tribocorum]|uniref:Uncharacterized protein n=1 Tax=Bartonella tribocorum TaxID=85701 RepID=A0A2M6USG7_9HYPH|nr:hypothetical protein [Bartonella tribocorum]PIT69094.1 hypothetical protein CER18_04600 [Bartonella tribocorum]